MMMMMMKRVKGPVQSSVKPVDAVTAGTGCLCAYSVIQGIVHCWFDLVMLTALQCSGNNSFTFI